MEEKKGADHVSGSFTWKINQFLNLGDKVYYSEVFVIGGFKWRIQIYPKGINSYSKGYLSMYLDVADSATLPSGWTRYAEYSLTVVNQLDSNKSITNGSGEFVEFKAKDNWTARGYSRFMLLSEISDLSKSYIVNGICVVEAKVSVRKGDIKILDQESGELIDFRGLGRVDLAFHPLLEEVCLLHPSLIECQAKRSRAYVEFAFTTLGRLLHFLKTTKVKDVNQDGFERLQFLWDELETFKFNLAWLQPHVRSVFGMKNTVGRVKRMKEDVTDLENEIKRRTDTLAAAEVELESAIKRRRDTIAAAKVELESAKADLVKAEQGFDMINGDMNREIGYPLSY